MSPEYLLEVFDYNREEGALYWASSRPASHFATIQAHKVYLGKLAGKRAGCVVQNKQNTYRQVRVDRKLYYEHRLIWLLETGMLCAMIDHLDGDGLNNKISNLVESSHVPNGKNCRLSINNTSGVNGVWWHKSNNNWVAEGHYSAGGKRFKISLGSFDNLEAALAARLAWDAENGYTNRHGKA